MAWAETTLQSSLTRNFTLLTYSTPTCALPFTPPTLPLPPTHHKQRLSDYSLHAFKDSQLPRPLRPGDPPRALALDGSRSPVPQTFSAGQAE